MLSGAKFIGLKVAQVQGCRIDELAEVLPFYHVIVNWMDGPNEKEDGHYSLLKFVSEGMVHLEDRTIWVGDFEKKFYDMEKEGRVNRWAMIIKKN
jgi:hypothetical protein